MSRTHTTGYTTDDDGFALMHARYGGGWDDETDTRERVVEVEDEDAPRVERMRPRTRRVMTEDRLPHAPGAHWEDVSCLCDCHFGAVTRAGAPACDDAECRKAGITRARFYERQVERKVSRKARRLAREAKGA